MTDAPGSVAEAIALRAPLSLRVVQSELIHAAWCKLNHVGEDVLPIELNFLLNVMHHLGLPSEKPTQ